MSELEHVPPEEAIQIENITKLTVQQLRQRYPGETSVLRGVHAKTHGCATARFTISDALPAELRVGVFATPGRVYEAWVRFSNASVAVTPDSPSPAGVPLHGSRGMAVKLLGVEGTPLVPAFGPLTQDFLMINEPVFTFSNVEDYEALSQVLLRDKDSLVRFFAERIHKKPDGTPADDPITQRTLRTAGIIKRIQSNSLTVVPLAYQPPPVSPLDNRYFSASPYLFGESMVMKFSARPVSPVVGVPDVADPNYLGTALRQRLSAAEVGGVVFDFEVQVRAAGDLAGRIEAEIEDACFEWDEKVYPFVKVATLTIPPQEIGTEERRSLCEGLVFTPWHGLAEHRPLGGINRLRRAVYEASAAFRHLPKEPARL